jgi:uncharacterized protein YodC (DUF2158 family)
MAVFKSGDLVVLKSGGPTMTVDTVNTDIFDDDKITGVLCAWFTGEKFQRVRFDCRAIEHANLHADFHTSLPVVAQTSPPATLPITSPSPRADTLADIPGDYGIVIEEMMTAMNAVADAGKIIVRSARRQPRRPAGRQHDRHDEQI